MKTLVSVLQKFFHLLNVLQVKKTTGNCISSSLIKYCSLIGIFLIAVMFLPAQDFTEASVGIDSSTDEIQATTDDYQPIVVFSSEENTTANLNTQQESQPSTVWLFVRMILVLLFVIACIYFVVYFLKKTTKAGVVTSDPYLRVVATISLSPGKSIYVITLNSVGYILGVTDNAINLIGSFEDKDLIDSMNLNADKNNTSSKPKDFASILNFFHFQKKSQVTSGENDSVLSSSSEFMQKQLERLKDVTDNSTDNLEDNL